MTIRNGVPVTYLHKNIPRIHLVSGCTIDLSVSTRCITLSTRSCSEMTTRRPINLHIRRSLSATAAVVVRVEDVADSPPEFVVVPPVTRIPEDLPVGSQVMQGQSHGVVRETDLRFRGDGSRVIGHVSVDRVQVLRGLLCDDHRVDRVVGDRSGQIMSKSPGTCRQSDR